MPPLSQIGFCVKIQRERIFSLGEEEVAIYLTVQVAIYAHPYLFPRDNGWQVKHLCWKFRDQGEVG